MRLIDADGECVIKASDNTGYKIECKDGIALLLDEYGQGICEFILDDIPTAYDVDKVVERLEDMRLKREEQLRVCADNDIADYFRCKMSAIAETIEIVKSGSIE